MAKPNWMRLCKDHGWIPMWNLNDPNRHLTGPVALVHRDRNYGPCPVDIAEKIQEEINFDNEYYKNIERKPHDRHE